MHVTDHRPPRRSLPRRTCASAPPHAGSCSTHVGRVRRVFLRRPKKPPQQHTSPVATHQRRATSRVALGPSGGRPGPGPPRAPDPPLGAAAHPHRPRPRRRTTRARPGPRRRTTPARPGSRRRTTPAPSRTPAPHHTRPSRFRRRTTPARPGPRRRTTPAPPPDLGAAPHPPGPPSLGATAHPPRPVTWTRRGAAPLANQSVGGLNFPIANVAPWGSRSDGHADPRDVEGLDQHLAAEFRRAGGGVVGVGDREGDVPVRGPPRRRGLIQAIASAKPSGAPIAFWPRACPGSLPRGARRSPGRGPSCSAPARSTSSTSQPNTAP